MKKQLALFAVLLLTGCDDPRPVKVEKTSNPDRTVSLLFEHNGCRVYRFEDGGRNIYYSDCRGQTGYTYTTQQGKTTVTHHVDTLNN